jgi:hypothetical protein
MLMSQVLAFIALLFPQDIFVSIFHQCSAALWLYVMLKAAVALRLVVITNLITKINLSLLGSFL